MAGNIEGDGCQPEGRLRGNFDHKKHGAEKQSPGADADQEKETEAAEREAPEPEHARMQSQLGNQGVLGMISARGAPGGQGAGVETEHAIRKKPHEKDGQEYGGDDDGDPGPITVLDLTQSWNPSVRRTQDRQAFEEPMPDEELPAEDEAFLEAVRTFEDPLLLPVTSSLDPLLQPSAEVVRFGMTDWSRAASRWADPSLPWQVLARLLAPPGPLLQDPHGRVLMSRAHAGAIASCMLLASPALGARTSATNCAAIGFCLELEARRHRVRTVRVLSGGESEKELPLAAKILSSNLPPTSGRVRPRSVVHTGIAPLADAFEAIADFDDPMALVPELPDTPIATEDPDDPLGLDQVMESLTGGAQEKDAPIYQAAILAAERIAAASAHTRVVLAGASVVLGEVAQQWSAGSPGEDLVDAMASLDRDIAGILQLLVEIARAAQRRSVPPVGLGTGLRRAARSLDRVRKETLRRLTEIAWSVLPANPDVLPGTPEIPTSLADAWAEGRHVAAVEALAALPPSLDRDTAILFARGTAGVPAPELLRDIVRLRGAWALANKPKMATVLGICLGPTLLSLGRLVEAGILAAHQLEVGRRVRNGLLVADAALLRMEVDFARGDLEALTRHRLQAGNLLWRMGAEAGLSLLARWRPPADETPEAPSS